MASSSKRSESAQMETFQSMLQSLNIPDPTQGGSAKITPEMMHQLSQRIMGILGDSPAGDASTQSAITEDGLPVVEINEHEDDDTPPINTRGDILPEDDLLLFDKLTPAQRAQQQDEVNRLLDELEKEEEKQQQIQRLEAQDWAERKKAESAERAKYGRATPAQKPSATTSPSQPRVGGGIYKGTPQPQSKLPPLAAAKKKSVHFNDTPADRYEDEDDAVDTGDLVFAQLDNSSVPRKPAPSTSSSRQTLEKLSSITPMKLNVIERQPGKPDLAAPPPSEAPLPQARVPSSPAPAPIPARIVDSDDETPPASPSSVRSAALDDSERPLTASEQREIEERHNRLRTNVELDREELDALGRGRGGIGSGGWDEENVPLDATLSATGAPIHKSSISRFKAERIAASGGSISVPEIIPAGALGGAIRMGHLRDEVKLEGNGDSDSDEDLWTSHADTFEALKNFGMGGGRKGKGKVAAAESAVPLPAPPVVSEVKERAPVRSIVSSSIVERPPRPRTNGATTMAAVQAPAGPAASEQAPVPAPKKISRFRAEKLGGAE